MVNFFLDFFQLLKDISNPLYYVYIFFTFIYFQMLFSKKTLYIFYRMYLKGSMSFKSLFKLVFKELSLLTLFNIIFMFSLNFFGYELSTQTIPFILLFIMCYNLFIYIYHIVSLFLYVCYKHRKDILNNMINI